MPGRLIGLAMVGLLCASASTFAQADSADARIAQLEQQLAAQRELTRSMAEDLAQAKREIEGLETYLVALDQLDAYKDWKVDWPEKREKQRAAELQKIREQRAEQMRAERERRKQAMAQAQQQQREAVAQSPRYSVQATLGLIELEGGTVTYIESSRLGRDYFLEEKPRIDRQNVMIRGTFKNESALPYRYEFEIGVAGFLDGRFGLAQRGVIGRWRYQTPELKPGELHQFEVKVPVSDSYDVTGYDVGKVSAIVPAPPNAP